MSTHVIQSTKDIRKKIANSSKREEEKTKLPSLDMVESARSLPLTNKLL